MKFEDIGWGVHRGDSLFEISRMKGISIHSIEQLNGHKSALLTPNMTLLLPARTAATQHSEIHTFATVQAGDTLWKIAHQYSVSVETLALLNGIASLRELPLGTVLMIPPKKDVYSSPSGWPVENSKMTAVPSSTSLQASAVLENAQSNTWRVTVRNLDLQG
ncbi:LysM peptidoglycan-binding domain-containing protein [Ferroacidibacillus organovorans]|uniref:LysM peptidoglycan-binding domain-containing protein n=1 Tax=Ferroacidibacillus organovorans TaxID=1765683 RepID=UPI0012E928BD|nr:LysM peptidoglycan-binding domain-containing protein [Ferroacidibacillus organovorans]